MKRPDNFFLVGLMGAGKSSVGRQLANLLHKDFIDSDSEIERRTGADIPLIFELEGEAGFRQRESRVIEELTRRQNIVLATGGGVVLDQQNREVLKTRGFVIYLQASVEQLFERTSRDRRRPLLQTDDPHARLTELLRQREPLYEEIADLVVNTDRRSVHQVVDEIRDQIGSL
jgi:shikimate kinase